MSELVESLPDLFHGLGHIRTRRMFGGHGVYADDHFFALVDDGVLYLKADVISSPAFEERGLNRFEYVKDGKVMKMAYYRAPVEVLEDPDEALHWGRLAIDAAKRAK
jgi:DNA transformation protein and related proteins